MDKNLKKQLFHVILWGKHLNSTPPFIKRTSRKKAIMLISIDSTPQYELSPYLFMQFAEPLGTADSSIDAAWDFKNNCWQKEVVETLKDLAPTMIRWGGCFASYYHWREAVGPTRIPMHNLCWDGIYLNQVGTAELAELARTVRSELLMTVNFLGDGRKEWLEARPGDKRWGTAEEAAAWIRYCNDPDDPLRLSHGVKEPYNIRYWQIGNETGYAPPCFRSGFTSEENARHASEFASQMLKADPSVRLIVWGDGPNQVWKERFRNGELSDWTKAVCESTGDKAELVAKYKQIMATPVGKEAAQLDAAGAARAQKEKEFTLSAWMAQSKKEAELEQILAACGEGDGHV